MIKIHASLILKYKKVATLGVHFLGGRVFWKIECVSCQDIPASQIGLSIVLSYQRDSGEHIET